MAEMVAERRAATPAAVAPLMSGQDDHLREVIVRQEMGPLLNSSNGFHVCTSSVSSQTRYRLADLSRCTDLGSPTPLGRLVTGAVGLGHKGRAKLLWQSPPECQTVDGVLAAAEEWLQPN